MRVAVPAAYIPGFVHRLSSLTAQGHSPPISVWHTHSLGHDVERACALIPPAVHAPYR